MHHAFTDNNTNIKTHWLTFIKNSKNSRLLYSNLLTVDEDSLLEGNVYVELLADREFRKHLARNYKDNHGAKINNEDIKKFFLAQIGKLDTSDPKNSADELADFIKLSGIFEIEIPSDKYRVNADVSKQNVEVVNSKRSNIVNNNKNDNAPIGNKENNTLVNHENTTTSGTTNVHNNNLDGEVNA